MLSRFKCYRRWRGGRWARITGWFWGKRWVRVPNECVETIDEDYRRTSGGAPYCRHGVPMSERCDRCRITRTEPGMTRFA
jgi:hypothetical protein